MQCPGGDGLPIIVFPIVIVSWSSTTLALLATKARWSKSIPCVDCLYLLTLTRQPNSVGDKMRSSASEREGKYVLTESAQGLQQHSRKVLCLCMHDNFRLGARERHECFCLPFPARVWRNVTSRCLQTLAREQENSVIIFAHQPQPGSWGALHPLSGFSKYHEHSPPLFPAR